LTIFSGVTYCAREVDIVERCHDKEIECVREKERERGRKMLKKSEIILMS
jgi:hypothetical protein